MAEGLDLGMDTLKVGKLGLAPGFSQGVARLGQLSAERKKADEKYEADSSGLQASMTKERAAADALPVPKLDKVASEFKYQGVKGEDLRDMMQTWFAFAAIGGAMTRQPMTAALNAFSGAIKGFVQGDKLEYDRQKDEFDRNFKTAIAKNQQAQQEYKLAFDKHRGNMQDLMNEWSIIAKKHGDTVASSNMERQDIQAQLRHIEGLAKMELQARRQEDMMRQFWARQDQQERTRAMTERLGEARINAMLKGIEARNAASTAKTGDKEKDKAEGKKTMTDSLKDLYSYYDELHQAGGAISQEQTTLGNLFNIVAGTGPGAIAGRASGSESTVIRDRIEALKPILISNLKQATGMGASQLNSDRELKFYLQAMTDTGRDVRVAQAAIYELNRRFGTGLDIPKPDEGALKDIRARAPKPEAAPSPVDALLDKYK